MRSEGEAGGRGSLTYNRAVLTAWDLQAITGPRPTGLGYSVRLLLDAYRQYGAADGGPAQVLELRPNVTDAALRGVPDRLAWEQWRLPRQAGALRPRPELLYCPALGAPLHCALPRVAHVHDLIPLAEPQQFSGAARWYWTRLLPACWRRSAVITVSNSSLVDEVADRLAYPRERVHVVPYYAALPPDATPAVPPAASAAPPYFLTLASHEPRKNLGQVLVALSQLAKRGLRPRLICAGGHTAHTCELQMLAAQLGVAEQVEWPGYAERQQTLALLRGATALLFVSRLEGYGMPPQEAQALGTPVVLSDIPCHRAVYDDAARWEQVPDEQRCPPPLVAVKDSSGLAELMQRLLEDATWRGQLSAAGLAYQQTFSVQSTAQALRIAFEAVLR